MHYTAIFAAFQRLEKKIPLLAMAPLLDDDKLDAPANVNFICETLKIYGSCIENFAFFVGDNCSTNGAIARLCRVALVGCYLYKFNLAVKRWLLPFEEDLTLINDLLRRRRSLGFARLLSCAETVPPTRYPDDPPPAQYDRRGSKSSLDDDDDSEDVKEHPRRSKRLMTLAQRYSEGFSMAVVDMCFLVEGTPRNYNEAVKGPEASKWTKAIDEELAALNDYGTWEETDVVPKRALDTTWEFKIKTDKDGNVARRKASLVIRGYMQIPGVDFGDTCAHVARVNSMRCVLAIAASRDYEIKKFDVDSAFLNPAIDYEIYIKKQSHNSLFEVAEEFVRSMWHKIAG
ncbi:hypothetical protein AeRB84_006443 [Aphanomyces euteiches]|nr:hypothetical protein AeRB84_006443 [Aphanomyces euteiches]